MIRQGVTEPHNLKGPKPLECYNSKVIDEPLLNADSIQNAPEQVGPLNYFLSGVKWERVNLTITLAPSTEVSGLNEASEFIDSEFFAPIKSEIATYGDFTGAFLVQGKNAYKIICEPNEFNEFTFTINVTNFIQRKRIPTGAFKVLPVINGAIQAPASMPMSDVEKLEDYSRIFQYNGNKSAYSVSFGITEDDLRPELLLKSYQYATPGGKAAKKGPLARIKRAIKRRTNLDAQRRMLNRYYRLCRKLNPPTGSRILFASEARTDMGGNLLSISNRLEERGIKFETDTAFTIPSTMTKRTRLANIKKIAAADVIVLDDYYPTLGWLKINPKTVIVQAWHAGSGFKNVGYSRFGKYGSPKLESPHRKYTYSIAGSTQLTHTYAEAFGIEESAVIPTGLPRIDDFLDEVKIESFKQEFYEANPELAGKKLVLFAPTFRGRGINTAYYDYSQINFDELYEYCGDDTVILFRMHHFIDQEIPIPAQYADRMKNFTHFKDGLNLLHVVDIMITDYSSIIYEYSMLERPMLFFSYDREVYEATRGFHRDYKESAPGKVCDTFDELLTALKTEDFEMERVKQFQEENFDAIDRGSSDRFIDWILLKHLKPLSHDAK